MPDWWTERDGRSYWVEIRRVPGIGSGLECPTRDRYGGRNGWYELVPTVSTGDVIYHYNARESRFVGRSTAATDGHAERSLDAYVARLENFEPITAQVGLPEIENLRPQIVALRDRLQAEYGSPLYLPFQFRVPLRMMSNYFARFPVELLPDLFGLDGLGNRATPVNGDHGFEAFDRNVSRPSRRQMRFLDPFRARADSEYVVNLLGGARVRTRDHETLVNACAAWLSNEGYHPACNAAVDLGLEDPPTVIEAEIVRGSWANAIREAVGQLYEYRYFRVADPKSGLIFLANRAVPSEWVRYLEHDREIGTMWLAKRGFVLSRRARQILQT